MCIFKVENKRIGRKRNLVMHKMSCWKQKVFCSFKTNSDFNLYSTPPAWTQMIVLCSDRRGGGKGRDTHSPITTKAKGMFWCEQLNSQESEFGDGHVQSTFPGTPPVLQQTIDVFPKLGPLCQDWSFACAPHSCGCEFPVEIKALVPKAGGWRLHVSWSHAAPNQVPLFQYSSDRSISSRDRGVLLENTIFNFLFISGLQARLGTLKTWCCNNLFCLFSFFKWGNAAFIPLWKGWSEQTGTNDNSAAMIFLKEAKTKV